eukprot:4178925-Ditylum_brightwellii.AAC.1
MITFVLREGGVEEDVVKEEKGSGARTERQKSNQSLYVVAVSDAATNGAILIILVIPLSPT